MIRPSTVKNLVIEWAEDNITECAQILIGALSSAMFSLAERGVGDEDVKRYAKLVKALRAFLNNV